MEEEFNIEMLRLSYGRSFRELLPWIGRPSVAEIVVEDEELVPVPVDCPAVIAAVAVDFGTVSRVSFPVLAVSNAIDEEDEVRLAVVLLLVNEDRRRGLYVL